MSHVQGLRKKTLLALEEMDSAIAASADTAEVDVARHALIRWREVLSAGAASRQEAARLREALTPSGDTKAAYMGEFSFNLHRIDEFGDEYSEKVYVPWTTIKEIMAAVAARDEDFRVETYVGADAKRQREVIQEGVPA